MALYQIQSQDTLWCWMAVLGRFIGSFMYVGTAKAYGVLIPHLVEQLQSTEGTIGLCGSLFVGLPHVAGTVTTVLVKKYDVRKVIMLGGIITVLGLLAASVSTNALQLGISLSLTGFCSGFCIIACIMPLTWYFPAKFALVNSISASGGAIGMIIVPPVTEYLLQLYGWRGTLMLLAALNSHYIVSGAIVKKPRHVKYTPVRETNEDTKKTKDIGSEKRSMKDRFVDIVYYIDGHIFNLFPVFIDFQLLFLISGTTAAAWVLFLVPSSMDKGVSSKSAALLSTIGGIGQVFGRLVQGSLISWEIMTDLQLFGILSILCALFFTIDPWLSSYLTYGISAFVVGFVTGAQYTLCLGMTERLITKSDLLLSAMGWTQLFIGVGKIFGGTLKGYLSDATGKYTVPFLTLGGLEIVSLVVILKLELKTRF